MDHYEKVKRTEIRIKTLVEESTKIMIKKNTDRVDAWKGSGLWGQFIEIYSMFMRLKVLIWDKGVPSRIDMIEHNDWKEDIRNALVDMRNFTILAELCLEDENIRGEPSVVSVSCAKCGHVHKLMAKQRIEHELQGIQKREGDEVS